MSGVSEVLLSRYIKRKCQIHKLGPVKLELQLDVLAATSCLNYQDSWYFFLHHIYIYIYLLIKSLS